MLVDRVVLFADERRGLEAAREGLIAAGGDCSVVLLDIRVLLALF